MPRPHSDPLRHLNAANPHVIAVSAMSRGPGPAQRRKREKSAGSQNSGRVAVGALAALVLTGLVATVWGL